MVLQTLLAAGGSDFFKKEVMLGGNLNVQYWELLVAIVVLALLSAAVIVCAVIASKKGKRKSDAAIVDEQIDVSGKAGKKKSEDVESADKKTDEEEILSSNSEFSAMYVRVNTQTVADDDDQGAQEEDQGAQTEPEAVEEIAEEVPAEEPVEEEATEEEAPADESAEETEEPVEEEAAEETKEEEAKVEEIVAAEEEEEKPMKEEKKEVRKAAPKKAEPKKTEPKKAEKAPVKKEEPKDAKILGKIEICNSEIGGFNYLLRANNGQLLYESKAYKSMDSCKEAIDNFIEAVKAGMFSIRADKFKNYKFVLKSPTSNNLIYVGESFSTRASCENNIESVKRFAVNSKIVDITEKDYVAKFVKYEIPADIVKTVEKKEGAPGKWVIDRVDESKNAPFEFLLYANNGQLLYESRDYKSYATCYSGLTTFVNTVKTGMFAIDPDKSGRFKFVLRSAGNNAVVEYYGQNYDTRKGCANSIESVYRFALLSPIPEK